MEFYEVVLFNWHEKKEDICVHFQKGSIVINSSEHYPHWNPRIVIHLDEDDRFIVQFKNAVLSAFNLYMSQKKVALMTGGDEDDLR